MRRDKLSLVYVDDCLTVELRVVDPPLILLGFSLERRIKLKPCFVKK